MRAIPYSEAHPHSNIAKLKRRLHPLERPEIAEWAMITAVAINNRWEIGLTDSDIKEIARTIDQCAMKAYKRARGIP